MKSIKALLYGPGLVLLTTVVGGAVRMQANPVTDVDSLQVLERELRDDLQNRPRDPVTEYNLGTVLLLLKRESEGRRHLIAAREAGEEIRGDASYNLGTADLLAVFADSTDQDPGDRLRRSIAELRNALLADPADADARWNLELAMRQLAGEPPPAAGGDGSGGGGNASGPGSMDPQPRPSTGGGPLPDFEPSPAEELLRTAQEREMEVQRERLRKVQPETIRP